MGYRLSSGMRLLSRGGALFPRAVAAVLCCALLLLPAYVPPAHAFLGLGKFTIKDEKELGRKFEILIRSQLPLVEDPEIAQYVRDLVARLAKHIPPQPFPFTSGVILHNSLNAFAVPGGNVFVFTGLIMNLDNESELAGVLAHELAHVTQRHVANRMERAKYVSIGSLLLAIAGIAMGGAGGGALATGAMSAGQSAMLNYSRIDENEADHIGYQYLVAAGFPPQGMAGGFQKLRQKSWMSGVSVPTYLSTHPQLGDRINGIMARVKAAPPGVRARKDDNRRFHRAQTLLWARYGDTAVALQRFKSMGNTGIGFMGQAMIHARLNQVREATACFDKALALSPGDQLIIREAGIFHFRKGNKEQAEKLLQQALRMDSRDFMAGFYYARLLDETGRAAQADSYYKDVLRALPEDQEVHAAYGRSLGQSGKSFEAYLHLAYSALYGNEKKKTEQLSAKAKNQIKTVSQRAEMERFERRYEERKKIWKEGM